MLKSFTLFIINSLSSDFWLFSSTADVEFELLELLLCTLNTEVNEITFFETKFKLPLFKLIKNGQFKPITLKNLKYELASGKLLKLQN